LQDDDLDLISKLQASIPKDLLEALWQAHLLAEESGQEAYLVGGAVRDTLLGLKQVDVDITVIGPAVEFAESLAERIGGRLSSRSQFGTVKLHFGGHTIDIATAREESYAAPGALPTVRPAPIIEIDLYRRDFTINAMAIAFEGHDQIELVDPWGGLNDLLQEFITVMHSKSFQDDPTRALRAVRYEQRLGFMIDPYTERLIREDLHYTSEVSGERLWNEIERSLEEDYPEKVLLRCQELGILKAIHPDFVTNRDVSELFQQLRLERGVHRPNVKQYICLVLLSIGPDKRMDVANRLKLPGKYQRLLQHMEAIEATLPQLATDNIEIDQLYRCLKNIDYDALVAYYVWTDSALVRERIDLYIEELKDVKSFLNGEDIVALGIPEGPAIGKILERLLYARVNGEITTRAEELELAKKLAQDLTT